jgi:hypothetical protein
VIRLPESMGAAIVIGGERVFEENTGKEVSEV